MDKKQIALSIAIASFCAATMTSCIDGEVSSKYGAQERYYEYNEEFNQSNDKENNKSDTNQDNSNNACQDSNNKTIE